MHNSLVLKSDFKKMTQVFMHLLTNAYKYTSEGKIKLKITNYERYQSSYIEITVKDTGTGIPEDRQPNLFRMFQMDFRNGINNQGLGLGLMLVKSIADAMKGQVNFISH